ncbi:MAG: hypothetical protein ABI855_04895, partial [Bacteroidota bacterium]
MSGLKTFKVNKQILLVDDDTDDHEIFCMALEDVDKGYKCVFAKDGIEALQILNHDTSINPKMTNLLNNTRTQLMNHYKGFFFE